MLNKLERWFLAIIICLAKYPSLKVVGSLQCGWYPIWKVKSEMKILTIKKQHSAKLCVVYAGCVTNVKLGLKSSRRTNTLAYIGSTYFARKPFGRHNCFGRLLLWPTHFWPTKWFGRHIFGRQNDLADTLADTFFVRQKFLADKNFCPTNIFVRQTFLSDKIFNWHLFVDKMFWSTPFLSTKCFGRQNRLVNKMFYQHIFGRQNDLADNIFCPTQLCYGLKNSIYPYDCH